MEIKILLAIIAVLAIAAVLIVSYEGRKGEPMEPAFAGASEQPGWSNDVNAALKRAATEKKLVLVDVYTPWCGYCKMLDRDTYSDPAVMNFLNSGFVLVKLNAEDGKAGTAFARENGVQGYPAIILLDPSGKRRGMFYGYRSASAFPSAVTAAVAGKPDK